MNSLRFIPIFLAALCCIVTASNLKKSYHGYSVYRFKPLDANQLQQARTIMQNNGDKFDFWSEPSALNRSFDVMTAPHHKEELLTAMRDIGLRERSLIRDVSKRILETSEIDFESKSLDERQSLDLKNFHQRFRGYSDIELKLNDVSNNSATKMKVEQFGASLEGRPLYVVKFSQGSSSTDKPLILIDAGHHAREWISHSTAMYIIDYLAAGSSRDKSVFPLVDNMFSKAGKRSLDGWLNDYDVWVVPTVNPDGYEHSHRYDRMWRKNRRRNTGQCAGVDLNRNYPYHWNEAGASQRQCDAIYAGPSALSEPESKSLADLIYGNRQRMVMYLSLHSYSQVILSPYGYRAIQPPNYNELARVAYKGLAAIRSLRNTVYEFGTAAGLLYPAAGGSDDYAYGVAGVPLVYTLELSPSARDYATGFLAPPSEIIPVGSEIIVGIAAMIEEMNVMRKANELSPNSS